jgi:ketosteroid isomerase-like protein
MSAIEVVKAYLAAVERFDVAGARQCLHPQIIFTERPNRLNPGGTERVLEVMMEGLPKGAAILRRQRYAIVSMFGEADRVAVEARWEGILNVPLGTLQPGDAMIAHIAMMFQLRDGLIWRQTNYDCYEAF